MEQNSQKNNTGKIDNIRLTEYVEKAQKGDKKALEGIITETTDYIYYYCLNMLKNEQDALDAVQDILIVVIEKMNKVKEPKAFLGWLKMVTANYCTNKVTRKTEYALSDEDEDENNILEEYEDFDDQEIPDEKLDNEETRNMIIELIRNLPEAQRECILMYYYQEMSVSDIAETVGVSEGTIKSRLNYGRKAIKTGVEGYEKMGIKLYGLGVLPFLSYFLTTGASALSTSVDTASILSKKTRASQLSRIVVDSNLVTSISTTFSSLSFSDALNSLAGKIAVGVMAATLLINAGVAGLIASDEENKGKQKNSTTTTATSMATPDSATKKHYVSSKIKGNKTSKTYTVATPDTAVPVDDEQIPTIENETIITEEATVSNETVAQTVQKVALTQEIKKQAETN